MHSDAANALKDPQRRCRIRNGSGRNDKVLFVERANEHCHSSVRAGAGSDLIPASDRLCDAQALS